MKVEIDFPTDYLTDKPGVIHLGRIYLGPSANGFVGRLVFCADGAVRLAVLKGAVEQGMIILNEPISEDDMLALGTQQT